MDQWARRTRSREISRRIETARREARLGQKQAAIRLGRGQSFVSKCESNKRRIDAVELEEFARVYQKPILFFFERDERDERSAT